MARLFALIFACTFLTITYPAAAQEMPRKLFGAPEEKFSSIDIFYKWTSLLARYQRQQMPALWQRHDDQLRALPLMAMAARVNRAVNSYNYISDDEAHGPQVWKTPQDFFARGGGSCQDFAIAKFLWLEHLGVPPNALRLAIVYDKRSDEPHAVTLLYDNDEILVLDNQDKRMRDSRAVTRYTPIYSINRLAWWRQEDDHVIVDPDGNVSVEKASRRNMLAASGG